MKYYNVQTNNKSIFKIFAIYYICMAVFCTVRIMTSLGNFVDGMLGDIIFAVVIQILVLFLLSLILYQVCFGAKAKQVFQRCNFDKLSFLAIIISIVLGIICFFLNIAVSSFFNGILTFTGYKFPSFGIDADYSTLNFFVQIFCSAMLPAFCEEFLNRGILLQGIKHCGFKRAIVISSLCFGLFHFNVQQFFYAFVIGLILGFVSVVAKNIFPAMIIHFMNNFLSIYFDFANARNWFLGDVMNDLQKFATDSNPFVIFLCSCLGMIFLVVLLCLFIWLLYKQSLVRKVNKAIDKVYNSPELKDNVPIEVNKKAIIVDLLEKNTLLNLDYQKMDNPIDVVLPKEKSRYKPNLKDNVFMWAIIVLGGLVTFFTYIWGLL